MTQQTELQNKITQREKHRENRLLRENKETQAFVRT